MEYKVIPFIASIEQNKGKSSDVAEQLETIINDNISKGWKYIRLESVSTFVNPDSGCFGLGAKPGYTTTRQMIVFQK
ncbi:hypothetical protein [Flavivirga jejuensis]|uniref:DUF4177 domain-containing protein n=1 Tax=Flavivirga jejuensis TaxID=870487 RepID=A0ABT8WR97_9FLAO|nr:hypothetical protein [Flavivirga jejuensis]MDO5975703.1 hypothetical protein [Flavivirga jejuensis]